MSVLLRVPNRCVPHATLPLRYTHTQQPNQSRFTFKRWHSVSWINGGGSCVVGINSNCVCKLFHISSLYYNSCPANQHRLWQLMTVCVCVWLGKPPSAHLHFNKGAWIHVTHVFCFTKVTKSTSIGALLPFHWLINRGITVRILEGSGSTGWECCVTYTPEDGPGC